MNHKVIVFYKDNDLQWKLYEQLQVLSNINMSWYCRESVSQILQAEKPDLIIVLGNSKCYKNNIRLVERIRQEEERIPIIMLTEYSSEARAIAALKAGVNDYYKSPICYPELIISIKKYIYLNRDFKNEVDEDSPIIGNSKIMQEIKDYLLNIASTDSTVFITGETGTGKELAAESIHRHSKRHSKPFLPINCAALPQSLFESELFGYRRGAFTGAYSNYMGKFKMAEEGTVFLDEIGEMNSYVQAKLLRVIETKKFYPVGGRQSVPVNVRIIAATNRNPEELIDKGQLRKDLYYRLNVARVHIPPLRKRKEDIPILLNFALHECNTRFHRKVEGFEEDALLALMQHRWPGNIRELKNLMEATFINNPLKKISFSDLPNIFKIQMKHREQNSEKDLMLSVLLTTNWNKSRAAQKLNWSRMTLYRKMAKYQITSSHPS